jgi:hypothetical protein
VNIPLTRLFHFASISRPSARVTFAALEMLPPPTATLSVTAAPSSAANRSATFDVNVIKFAFYTVGYRLFNYAV